MVLFDLGKVLVDFDWHLAARRICAQARARPKHPHQHTEAITSRPLLLHAIGKQTRHAGQNSLMITSTHAEAPEVMAGYRRLVPSSNSFGQLRSS